MRRLIALLAVILPTVALADLCGSNTERVYTLAASTPQTVGVGLTGRKQITVCSSKSNTATAYVQCRGDGTTVSLGDSYVGIQIWAGQCRVFGTPGNVPVSCVSNESSVVVKTEECTGSPPPAVINPPSGSATVSGTVAISSMPAVTSTDASTGATGANVPASASYMAGDNAAGKLTGVKIGATGGVVVEGVISGVPVPTSSAFSGPVTATWDSTTVGDTALQINTNGFTTVGIQYIKTGVVSTGIVTFEASYSASGPWTPITAVVTSGDTSNTTYTLTTGSTGWQVFVSGYPYFQVRLSTVLTGAGSATFALMASQAGVRPGSGAVHGDRAANTVLPDSRMLGVMPVISTAAAPSWTEGYVQSLSADLSGNLRVTAIPSPTVVSTASTPGTCTAVTTTATLLAVNASRRSVLIQAATANTANIRWAKASSATAAQMLLEPGQTFIFDGASGAIYTGAYSFISEDGTSQTVCVQEE